MKAPTCLRPLVVLIACACAAWALPADAIGQTVLADQQPRPRATPPPPPPGTTRPAPATPQPTPRQVARRPSWRGLLMGSALWQPTTASFTDARSESVFRETATTTGEYDVDGGLGADLGGIVRVWKNLGLGLAVSAVPRSSAAAFSTSSPHPFFFGRPRTATTDASGFDRTDTGVHVSAAYHVVSGSAWRFTLFGGPSVFAISQTAVDRLAIADTYPYDAITAAPGPTTKLSETAVGVHVGLDVSWYFSKAVGVGALARYAGASVKTSVADGEAFTLDAGGAQVGLGLRIRF